MTKEQIEERLANLRKQREEFHQFANHNLSRLTGAIEAMESLLEVWEAAPVKEEAAPVILESAA